MVELTEGNNLILYAYECSWRGILFFDVTDDDTHPLSGHPEKGTVVDDTSRNKPHAVVLFRTDPERYGVDIFARVRGWIGVRADLPNANVELLDLETLPIDEARHRVREAVQKGIHVFLDKKVVRRFRQVVEDHHLARMQGDPFYNLIWEYQIVKMKRKEEGKIRIAEAGYVPREEIPATAVETSDRLRATAPS